MALWARGQVAARGGDLDSAREAANEILDRLEFAARYHPREHGESRARVAAVAAGDYAEGDRQLTRCDEILTFYHAREPAADRFHGDQAEAVISLGNLERAEGLVARLEERAVRCPAPGFRLWRRDLAVCCTPLVGTWMLLLRNSSALSRQLGQWSCPARWGGPCSRWGGCTAAATSGGVRGIAWKKQCGCLIARGQRDGQLWRAKSFAEPAAARADAMS